MDKLNTVKTLLGITDESEDAQINTYLEIAQYEILFWRYSFLPVEERPTAVPPEYEMTQINAVVAGYNLRGAENQETHSENGINRKFRYSDMTDYIHAHVIPLAKIL